MQTIDFAIPSVAMIGNNQQFFAQFDRNPNEPDLSYQIDVYLYPKLAPFDPASQPFRRKYRAAPGEAHWGTGEVHHHDTPTPMRVDITAPVLDLVKARAERRGLESLCCNQRSSVAHDVWSTIRQG